MKISLISCLLCCIASFAFAQTSLEAEPTTLSETTTNILDAGLGIGNYTAYRLNTNSLRDLAASEVEEFAVNLRIGEESFSMTLTRIDILGPDFSVQVLEDESETEIADQLTLASYRGYLSGSPEDRVRLAISNLGISLQINAGPRTFFLAPTFVAAHRPTETDEYIWYEKTVLGTGGVCAPDAWSLTNFPNCTQPDLLNNLGVTQLIGPCARMLEIVADADTPFLSAYPNTLMGNITAVIVIFFTLESAEDVYRNEFAMGVQVNLVRLFRAQSRSPYSVIDLLFLNPPLFNTPNIGFFLNEIEAAWANIPQSAVPRDVVVAFTGNNCELAFTPPTILFGAARRGRTCHPNAPVFITRCVYPEGRWPLTMPHELGHSLGAPHPTGNNCTGVCNLAPGDNSLMCAGGCGGRDPLFLDNDSRNIIQNHIDTQGGCLGLEAEIQGPELLCPGQTATYTFVPNSIQPLGLTWSVSAPGLNLVAQSNTSVTVTAQSNYQGPAFLEAEIDDFAFMGGCDPTFRYNLAVGSLPAACTGPSSYDLCPGTFTSIPLEVPPGSTISNLTCGSPSNCGNIQFSFVGAANVYDLYVSSAQPGNYYFSYDVSNACNTTTWNLNVTVLGPQQCGGGQFKTPPPTRALRELALTVTPNPNTGRFALRYELPGRSRPEITIRNLTGQTVFSLPAGGWRDSGEYAVELDLDHLPSGMYLVQLRTATGQKTVRMNVQQ
ncbi:MAG: T9SS type A sorting domain-containing protein [Bacteroidota bacterium]